MSTFDIKKFEQKRDEKGEYSYKDGDLIIHMQKQGEYYLKEITSSKEKNLTKYYGYNNIGNLINESTYLLGIPINKGIYNENGEFISQDDYTSSKFIFTIEQLVEKMKHDYNIDLYNIDPEKTILRAETRINESGNKIIEWWVAIYYMEDGLNRSKTYRIDGKDGRLIGIEGTGFGSIP